ncbi:MAG: cholest-4-en-3-one 26-monooxygenase [Actinomycetota bacterium]|jgi:cytochrome P450 family 142 subfamily A polypeptide 1|nr:cholest-4-en-3-one 26-monooxygenase [Actinomycetota bacterium]
MAPNTKPDLLDESFYADLDGMHESFTYLRANDPVYRDPTSGMIGVTKHRDLVDVERRAKVFVSSQGYRSFWSPMEDNMIAQDDPGHAEQRSLVARRLTPKGVERDESLLRQTVTDLLDAVAEDGAMEVVDALAAQLPCRLTANLLGFPESAWPELKTWSERMMRIDSIPRDASGDVMQGVMGAITEFQAYLNEAVPRFRKEPDPHGSFISVWANAQVKGCPMEDQTIMNETGLFISGGAETTRTVIARGLRVFCDHQDQWEKVAADPSLVPSAVEEVIRWVTPLNQMFRTAVADDRIGDTPVSAGDRIALLYPSANRDEDVFEDPFSFDVTRTPNPQVAFGFGPHVCVGQSLARVELQILFEELTRRFTNLRVVTEPEIEENLFAGAVVRFDLAFDVR